MCVFKNHAFIYFLRPPSWSGTTTNLMTSITLLTFTFLNTFTIITLPYHLAQTNFWASIWMKTSLSTTISPSYLTNYPVLSFSLGVLKIFYPLMLFYPSTTPFSIATSHTVLTSSESLLPQISLKLPSCREKLLESSPPPLAEPTPPPFLSFSKLPSHSRAAKNPKNPNYSFYWN